MPFGRNLRYLWKTAFWKFWNEPTVQVNLVVHVWPYWSALTNEKRFIRLISTYHGASKNICTLPNGSQKTCPHAYYFKDNFPLKFWQIIQFIDLHSRSFLDLPQLFPNFDRSIRPISLSRQSNLPLKKNWNLTIFRKWYKSKISSPAYISIYIKIDS